MVNDEIKLKCFLMGLGKKIFKDKYGFCFDVKVYWFKRESSLIVNSL